MFVQAGCHLIKKPDWCTKVELVCDVNTMSFWMPKAWPVIRNDDIKFVFEVLMPYPFFFFPDFKNDFGDLRDEPERKASFCFAVAYVIVGYLNEFGFWKFIF